jgi:hypothetical protein
MIPQSEIGRRLMAGLTLAGAAAAGIPEASAIVSNMNAEYEAARAAKSKGLTDGSEDTGRQLCRMADDFERAVSVAVKALRTAADFSTGMRNHPGYRRHSPGAPAHCRHRRRA